MSKVVSTIFGGGSDPGILGTGQFRPDKHHIDREGVLDAAVGQDPNQIAARQQQQDFIQQLQQFGLGQQQTAAQEQAQQVRGQQMGLVDDLQAQARGEGPSLAQMQLQQATDRGVSQAAGMAASQRGVNPALAARLAQQGQAQIQQEAARDSAMIRAQEQLSAQQQLAQQLGQVRGQDFGVSEAERAERAAAQQAASGLRQQDIGVADSDRQARIALDQLGVQQATGMAGAQAQAYEGAAQRRQGMLSGGAEALGALAMLSDENKKENVQDGEKDLKAFLDAISAQKYNYKDPSHGEGTHVSPMAQDLEKTQIGKSMVVDTPEGKQVDYGKGLGAMLASQTMMNDRLSDIEKALRMKKERK